MRIPTSGQPGPTVRGKASLPAFMGRGPKTPTDDAAGSPRHSFAARAVPILLLGTAGTLALQPELRLVVPLLVGCSAFMTILLALSSYLTERHQLRWSGAAILTVAFLLRLFLLCGEPQLSDDLYRYLWDGSNTLRGLNPYAKAPSLLVPPPALASIHAKINHPEYVTIYPPAAQVLFAAGAALGHGLVGLKAFLMLLDLGLCASLLFVARRLGLPTARVALYAWNPLPVLEIAGSGHVDGAGLTLLMGALCLLLPGAKGFAGKEEKPGWLFFFAGALLAGAALVKLFPILLAPVLFLLVPAGRRFSFVAGGMGAVAALLLPFLPELAHIAATLDAYARNWEFAGCLFNVLRWLTGSGYLARLVLSGLFLLAYGAILLRLAMRLRGELSTVERWRRVIRACYFVALALLLLTPTLQPWYALCLAVFLPFCAGPAGLVLSWVVFLSYQVQIPYLILGQWVEEPEVTAALFVAPVAAGLLAWAGRRQARRSALPAALGFTSAR